MAGNLQPLVSNQRIVREDGTPTTYFTQWAQQRQIDITGAITAAQALTIIQQYMADHALTAGSGISLSPSGDINDNITVAAEVQAILDQITTTQGSVLFRGASAWEALAPGTSGDFLKTNGASADPTWAAASGGGGGGFFAVNAPPAGLTIWVNQGTATKTVQADGTITIVGENDSAESIRGVFTALPATPWSYVIGWLPSLAGFNFQSCGISLRDSVSGKLITFGSYRDASSVLWLIVNYNSPTSKNANVLLPAAPTLFNAPVYLHIADDGTTRTANFGFDPYYQPYCLYSVAHSSFIVPDQIGIYTDNINSSQPLGISVFSWK